MIGGTRETIKTYANNTNSVTVFELYRGTRVLTLITDVPLYLMGAAWLVTPQTDPATGAAQIGAGSHTFEFPRNSAIIVIALAGVSADATVQVIQS